MAVASGEQRSHKGATNGLREGFAFPDQPSKREASKQLGPDILSTMPFV